MALAPVNEDTIQCVFYSIHLGSDKSKWSEICDQINDTILKLSKNYIWQRNQFQLYFPLMEYNDADIPMHLCSSTCFGDNIEDEWFIVYLVLEISKQFQGLIIQITDNDGDLLLIEAADYLPKWVNTDNMDNRVFIYKNHIHIIPPEMAPLDTKLELKTALKIITESCESTQASTDIEQAILKRIGSYPEKILTNIHKAVVKLPSSLAALLILKPSLIAPIVDAYCNHDIIDTKCCKNMDFSDYVRTEVKFTKYLYASLMHSKLINSVKHRITNSDKESILGLKLMCGFQMISSNGSGDLFSSKEYHRFVKSLKLNGYFKDNIEGSKQYNELLENAKEYFSVVESAVSLNLSHSISQLMESSDFKEIKYSLNEKYIVQPDYTGDNDDWLNINPEQLNELLHARYGKTTSLKNSDVLTSQSVTTELSSFLKQTSDFEGIEPNPIVKSEDNNIEFDPDQFVSCVEKMLNLLSTQGDDLNDVSDDDDDNMLYDHDEDDNEECAMELKSKLVQEQSENLEDSETILANIVKSMKEEKASTGPTSNLLRTIGINKSELLDSDDDLD